MGRSLLHWPTRPTHGPGADAQAEPSLGAQIKKAIIQRCTDPTLAAPQVAAPLGISTRTLHRALAACGETFGAALIAARVDIAVRMLESRLLRPLSVAEIGRRSGFADPAYFSQAIRQQLGRTPSQVRQVDEPV